MSSKSQNDNLPASNQMISRLETNRLLVLIKTEDHYFDDFFLRQLVANKLWGSPILINNAASIQLDQLILEGDSKINFIEISRISAEVIDHLCKRIFQKIDTTTQKEIYLLPAHLVHTSLNFPCKESIFSSSLFLSEQVDSHVIPALEEGLGQIFEKKISPAITSFFVNKWNLQKSSLSKLLLFASTFKQDVEKLISIETENSAESNSFDLFLDTKGTEFVDSFGFEISLESIQTFFRAFIQVDGPVAHLVELNREELSVYSKLPKEKLDKLLQVATSPTFQLLSERDGAYRLSVPEYVTEWQELKTWVSNEQKAFKQFKLFEEIALEYFKGTGLLLGKDRLDKALLLKEEIFTTYAWEEKYKVDKELFSSFLLLSQNYHEELLKTQQKKRASLLKNSIRISIAVGIAFLLSSFTALLAYLERNTAVEQQELAIKSKDEAEQARTVAEKERLEAVAARENEQSALEVAKTEREIAIEAKGQAEVQRVMAVDALILAKKSEQEASVAKDVAQKNEKIANEAKITAQINFETSEKLRNQQEARATALEALGYFSNENYATGIELVKKAYEKNLSNGGFPLQSDIFNALLSGIQASKTKEFEVELDFPAKLLALSLENDQLAVYTINGELRIYSTQPNLTLKSVIKTGYIKSYEFLSATEILGRDLDGKLFLIDLRTNTLADLSTQLPTESVKGFFKVLGQEKLWVAKLQDGNAKFYQYSAKNGFVNILGDQSKLLLKNPNAPIYWIEGNEFFRAQLSNVQPELIVKTTSTIHSATWSSTYARWILGLENGQIWSVDPTKEKAYESFAIHATKVSQLITMPYAHGTELMISTGFDGGLMFFVFDKNIPFNASVSSRVRFKGHRSWITGFSVDENKKTAYSISNDRTIKVWPLEINKLLTN
jgi:hypothetical protein